MKAKGDWRSHAAGVVCGHYANYHNILSIAFQTKLLVNSTAPSYATENTSLKHVPLCNSAADSQPFCMRYCWDNYNQIPIILQSYPFSDHTNRQSPFGAADPCSRILYYVGICTESGLKGFPDNLVLDQRKFTLVENGRGKERLQQ